MPDTSTMTLRERVSLTRFTRGRPDGAAVTLDRQRIYILPTRAGFGFVAMLALMLIGAINYQLSIGYACTFLLGSLAIVSILHTYRNLAGLTLRAGRCAPVFAGQVAQFQVQCQGSVRDHHAVHLQLEDGGAACCDIAAQTQTSATLARTAARRGELPIGRLTIATRYPLGLFRAWSHVNLPMHCLVYPRPAAPRPMPQHSDYRPSSAGDKGRGVDDFAGLRGYRGGDNLRQVYWKGAARTDNLLTKQFAGDRSDEVWIDYDALPQLAVEARLSQLCRWVLQAAAAQQHYGLRLPGNTLPLGAGPAHEQACLAALARFNTGGRRAA